MKSKKVFVVESYPWYGKVLDYLATLQAGSDILRENRKNSVQATTAKKGRKKMKFSLPDYRVGKFVYNPNM